MFIRLSQLAIAAIISVKLAVFAADDARYWVVDPLECLEHRLGELIDEIGRRRAEIREGADWAFRLAVAVRGARRRAIECGQVWSRPVRRRVVRICHNAVSVVLGVMRSMAPGRPGKRGRHYAVLARVHAGAATMPGARASGPWFECC